MIPVSAMDGDSFNVYFFLSGQPFLITLPPKGPPGSHAVTSSTKGHLPHRLWDSSPQATTWRRSPGGHVLAG